MIDRPTSHRQLGLLVPTANALEPSRIPGPTQTEVTNLLKLLISEHIVAGATRPPEAANE
jgi:hypothetical protein